MIDVPVLIVGAGAAGLMAALASAERCETHLVADGPMKRSNSLMAQGGLHIPDENPGSMNGMVDDILRSARVPLDQRRIREFVGAVPGVFERLISWGLEIDVEPDGRRRKRIAGGMSEPRIVTSGDQIGRPLMAVLHRRLDEAGVHHHPHHPVVDVEPRHGSLLVSFADGSAMSAKRVVMATGGTAYRRAVESGEQTTNPVNQNHVLYDRLLERGAETIHGGFFQYQPFGLVEGPPGPPARCVPESLAAEGVRRLDRRGRLLGEPGADRLAVTEAMVTNRARAIDTRFGPAFELTLNDLPAGTIATHYPRLGRTLAEMGVLDGPVLVYPFLHYQLGGLAVDPDGRSSLAGLFVAGEAAGGLHGRNRLMGNGLTDGLVNGWRAGSSAAAEATER